MTSILPFARIAAALAVTALSSLTPGCAPSPRNLPCSNDGECEKADPAFRYCLESRCVECVGSSNCGSNGTCVDGSCVISCKDERGCPDHRACENGRCARAD